ncbi:MAG: hypothetical protein IJA06_01230, partial [Oscillospiraceae bacterium]|nr:hypothetical protein [Oscillospiraceae bacterium]
SMGFSNRFRLKKLRFFYNYRRILLKRRRGGPVLPPEIKKHSLRLRHYVANPPPFAQGKLPSGFLVIPHPPPQAAVPLPLWEG